VALALPVSALATPHPDQGDKRAAKAECKTLRGTTEATTAAFLTRFRNFGACVAKRAVEEAVEEQNAHANAARTCREDRGTTTESREAFAIRYGTQEATEWKSAAEECDAARDASAETFATTWGTDEDAFGKCVSKTAQENNDEETTPQS
jgi:alpha/beta superfamily hydrolase